MCSIEACERESVTRGWCRLHYQRWRKYGDPVRARPTLSERIQASLRITPACWEWTGAVNTDGYGVVKDNGKVRRVARVVWELEYGPIPAGLVVCHSCDNPLCARLEHLLLGTQRANIQDMLAKGRRPSRRAA